MAKNGLRVMDSDLHVVDNFVVSTDWPHDDSRYPHAIDTFLDLPLGKESQKKVLWDNCARLYNL